MENEIYFEQSDIEKNKAIVLLTAILQCVGLSVLFFLPLVCCQGSAYGKFYANQGLLIFLLFVAAGIVAIIPILGWIASPVVGIATLVFAIMNAVNASKGVRKAIPIIGDKLELIK
ncbi:MAG: hypothetical protein ACI4KG_06415 [Oscillospiraceae bacterium]